MIERTPLPPRRPSETFGTPSADQGVIDRACKRIESAIVANPTCTSGFFSRTGCIGAARGVEESPALIALIDADPLSLFDHWYGLVGQWHGAGNGFVAGLLRLPMVDGRDFATVAGRIRTAWKQTISHPGRMSPFDLGGGLLFASETRNDVFAICDGFEDAVAELERMIRAYDRTRLRAGPTERWWTEDHPAHVFFDLSCTFVHQATSLHHWPDEPFARIDQLPEDPIVWEDRLTPVVAGLPQGQFTRTNVLRHVTRCNEMRWQVPETVAFLGEAPCKNRGPTPRPWLYGYAWADYTGWTWHGLIRSRCFFDGLARAPFFAFVHNAVFRRDFDVRTGSACTRFPCDTWDANLEADRRAEVLAAPVHWHKRHDELGTGGPDSLGPTEAQLAALIREELSPAAQKGFVDIPYQPLGRMP